MIALFTICLAMVSLLPAFCKETSSNFREAINDLALNLIRVASDSETTVFSPVSIAIPMAAVRDAADGSSKDELSTLLGLRNDENPRSYSDLAKYIQDATRVHGLSFGSRLYIQDTFDVQPEFQNIIKERYNMFVEKLDFTKAEAAIKIRDWVNKITGNNSEAAIGPVAYDTVLLLVSAIHFTDNWLITFDPKDTNDEEFHFDKSNSVKVPMMMMHGMSIKSGEDREIGARWIQLEYSKSDPMSMLLVLPAERFGLKKLIENMSGDQLVKMMNGTQIKAGSVFVPRFKVTSKEALTDDLRKLGVHGIFSDKAGLDEMVKSKTPIHVTDLIHQCWIEVNERGTDAAAVSAANFQFLSGLLNPPKKVIFRADEPFLFFIFDRENNVPIFAGKIADPRTT